MEYLSVKTKGNSNPDGKPRVYFTCHPQDFDRYFDKVCDDIFKTHDCAIYYTPDMTAPIPEEYVDVDFGRMNLFVMPITFRLLREPNRAMDFDYRFADEKHIAVLPLMMESGIDEFYSKKFGERQYLSPYDRDATAISYEQKLKTFLDSILISDETAAKVRAAFDAYIFLSYRKKDRHYANDLMKLIHQTPKCRDIAIWYDEFLKPGDGFRDSIKAAMEKSELFTMLVTPNLVNEDNFVQREEYPMAVDLKKGILPAQMKETDRAELEKKYPAIPECADTADRKSFQNRLLDELCNIAIAENDSDPEHNFLIGLAYLDGIDVEVNAERALELIKGAANAGCDAAMVKLYKMYSNGESVALDYREALKWAQALYDHRKNTLGEEHPDTLSALNNLGITYSYLGERQKALEIEEKVYALMYKILGEEHPYTLTALNNLGVTYIYLGEYKKALEIEEKVYALRRKILGEEHPDTLTALNNLGVTYIYLGEYKKALEVEEKVYALRRKILGEEHPDTLRTLKIIKILNG